MNKKKLRNIRLASIGCLLITAQLLITNYQLPTCPPNFDGRVFAQSVTEGFKAKKMEGEIVKWEIEADSAIFNDNSKTLRAIKVKFYPEGKEPFTVKADNGLVKENIPVGDSLADKASKKDEIYLENNVQIIGYSNSIIKCRNLSWDSVSEIMRSEDDIEIEGEKWFIQGTGIEFSPSGDVITIKKDVTMEIIGQ